MTIATLRAVPGAMIPSGRRPGTFLGWERVSDPEQAEQAMPLPNGGAVYFRRMPYFSAELTGEITLALMRGELERVPVEAAGSEPVTRSKRTTAPKE